MIFRLRNLRQEQNLSAKEVASKLNCSQSLIYEWEKGRSEPSVKALIKLADIYDCSIDYLLGREDDFGIIRSGAELQLKEDEAKLLGEYRLLDEINKIKVQTFVYALAH